MNEHENIIKGLVAVRQLLVAMEAASVGRTPLIENIEAVNRAIAALEPPRPVVPIRLNHTENKYRDHYKCQNCSNDLYYEQMYCDQCGKAVKWV